MKRITMIASGTRGDVQPAIALGKALQAAGYRVRILAGSGFCEWIERYGLEAAPSRVDIEAVMGSELGQEWVDRGHRPFAQQRLMQRLIDGFGPRLIRDAWDASQDADAVMSSFTSDTYALAIGEVRDIPVISMPLQPTMITTRDGRAMPNAPLPGRVSRINEWFGRMLIEPFPWRIYGKHVNTFRHEIGLAPQSSGQNTAARRRMTVIHGVSRHVMPSPTDWPTDFHVCGYLVVPEDRVDLDSRHIRLALAVFHPPGGITQPNPIVYLEGGPGGSSLKLLALWDFDVSYGPVLAQGRELILIDQRGVGRSEPALECPGFVELYVGLLDQRLDGARCYVITPEAVAAEGSQQIVTSAS